MNNIKVGVKIITSFTIVSILALILGFYAETSIRTVAEQDTALYELGTMPLKDLIGASESMQKMRVELRNWKAAGTTERRNAAIKEMDMYRDKAIAGVVAQYDMTNEETIKNAFRDVEKAIKEYGQLSHDFVNNAKKFDASSGVNLDEYPPEFLTLSTKMEKAMIDAVTIKLTAIGQLAEKNRSIAGKVNVISKVIMFMVVAFSILMCVFLSFAITRPLEYVVADILKLGKGDMTARVNLNRGDEFGELAKTTDALAANLQNIFRNMRNDSDAVASTSEELSSVSKQMASGAEETVAQSNTVATTTEQMSVNINAMASAAEQASVNANEVAGAAEQMSANMNTIAAAIEEMSASINQIASNTGGVREIAADATGKASEATSAMNKLGIAAKEIGQVTDVIKKIADKTNLLALNATIEAASAGESGKGFAVVAGEIKELANQSATSADDIARRIDGIQRETNDAVGVIHNVSEIIGKINESVEAIAGHVTQQTKASNEISSNVTQANTGAKRVASAISEVAKGTNDVSRNAGETAKGAHNVSSNAVSMNQVAKESAQGATQVNQSAGELARIASELKLVIGKFKI